MFAKIASAFLKSHLSFLFLCSSKRAVILVTMYCLMPLFRPSQAYFEKLTNLAIFAKKFLGIFASNLGLLQQIWAVFLGLFLEPFAMDTWSTYKSCEVAWPGTIKFRALITCVCFGIAVVCGELFQLESWQIEIFDDLHWLLLFPFVDQICCSPTI